jgi:hypothetical protein
MKNLLSKEPAVIIGIVAAAVLAAVQSLAGNSVIGTDLAATLEAALSPESGWALPIILGIVTRFFVFSPARADELLHTPPPAE